MRRTIGPFLTAGVMLAGATAVVVNPVVSPQTEIRVSTADLATTHSDLDLLDRAFRESIDTARSDAPDSAPSFETMVSEMVGVGPKTNSVALTDAIASEPVLALSVLAITPISVSPGGPSNTTTPESTAGRLRALAVIGTEFGDAGTAFIEQVGMAPAAIADLAEKVQAGQLAPDVAIRRLAAASVDAVIAAPATLARNSVIDELFKEETLAPIIDALTRDRPSPIGDGPGVAARATEVATDAPDTVDPSVARAPAAVAEAPSEAEIVEDPSEQRVAEKDVAGGNLIVQDDPEPRRDRAFRPGHILSKIGERIQQRLREFQDQLAGPQTETQTGDSDTESNPESDGATPPGE
jgi:hypothetical protein